MDLKVFKFGGASVKSADEIRNVGSILKNYNSEKIVVVISAMGKTTNALESVVNAYTTGEGNASKLMEGIKESHYKVAKELLSNPLPTIGELNDVFVEVDWVLEDEIHDGFNYVYDQIVSVGELASTKLVTAYLKEIGISVSWLDIRDVILTDDTYREAKVKWDETSHKVKQIIPNLLSASNIVITQGFIGGTNENNTTTLGREGSDYTAGILSYCLDAQSMHIWKDVPGILTADPAKFENVIHIPRLSYKEAVEMTYYGAKVIHPKTIKPIQNKSIPLHVRPFKNPDSEGTVITEDFDISYPPVVVVEHNQALIHISTTDFSFVAEHHLSKLFTLLAELRIKVNMMRNTAISFTISIDSNMEKLTQLIEKVDEDFKVVIEKDLELITIRHYSDGILEEMKKGRLILLEERLKETIRLVVKEIPVMQRRN